MEPGSVGGGNDAVCVCVRVSCGLACALDGIGADGHPVTSKSTLDVGLVKEAGGGGGGGIYRTVTSSSLRSERSRAVHLEWRVMFMHPPPPSLNPPPPFLSSQCFPNHPSRSLYFLRVVDGWGLALRWQGSWCWLFLLIISKWLESVGRGDSIAGFLWLGTDLPPAPLFRRTLLLLTPPPPSTSPTPTHTHTQPPPLCACRTSVFTFAQAGWLKTGTFSFCRRVCLDRRFVVGALYEWEPLSSLTIKKRVHQRAVHVEYFCLSIFCFPLARLTERVTVVERCHVIRLEVTQHDVTLPLP